MTTTSRDKLIRDLKRTKGVRFNASRRLEARDQAMARNTAYASSAVIVVTLLPTFFELNNFIVSTIVLMTVGLSIFILATTLLHSANNNALKADQFHRCALEVNALRRELLASDSESSDLSDFSSRYDEILSRYNINHADVDYDRYQLQHPEEFHNIAQEEVIGARKNVKAADRFAVVAGNVILVVTVAITIGAVSSNSVVVDAVITRVERAMEQAGTHLE